MRFRFALVVCAVFFGTICTAQNPEQNSEELYVPLEYQRAYQEDSRARSGKVAKGYWQNRSKYKIEANLEPETRRLEGKAAITYYNNSPDTIESITIQAYHDYLKPYAKRKYFFNTSVLQEMQVPQHEGFEIDMLVVAEDTVNLNNQQLVTYGGTNYTISLKESLLSQDSLEVQVKWKYTIPSIIFSRSGAIDSTSMFIAYWYPEIAVKDDVHGWDKSAYDTATEFYHDFSDYEITLRLPDNFIVWASVAPDNPGKVYSPQTRERLEQARNSPKAVKIWTENDFKTESTSSTAWKYKANNFPDFSFAISDHFVWEASMYKDKKRDVFAHVVYPPDHENYSMVMSTVHETLDLFHHTMPKYPFPFSYFTIFNGFERGGMEFPGMANNYYIDREIMKEYLDQPFVGQEEIKRGYLSVAVHEMGHMYMPFMVGTNEKNYAWMDEGFADFLEIFLPDIWPAQKEDQERLATISRTPLMVSSREHEESWITTYDFGSAMYLSLYNLLGESSFLKCLHSFMDEWKYKHPTPYDLVHTFNRESEIDLTWFFKNWLFGWGYIDVGIVSVENQQVEIRNNGGKAVSFKITTTSEDGRTQTEVINPAVWKDNSTYIYDSPLADNLVEVKLEMPLDGDAVSSNNYWGISH